MDRDDLRSVLKATGFDLWSLIETAISVAASDHGAELRLRRDGFVERLYAPPHQDPCHKLESGDQNQMDGYEVEEKVGTRAREEEKGSSSPMEKVFGSSPLTPQSNHREEIGDDEEDEEEREGEEEDEDQQQQRKIVAIKDSLEDPDQSDDAIAGLLQNLADMDITFHALQETDIGRHVNRLRKHPSAEVKRLVKQLIRKWKEIVDEWVNASEVSLPATIITDDGDSPQGAQPMIPAKSSQNGHKVPDFSYSPSPHNCRMSSNSNRETIETKPKAAPKREAPLKPIRSTPPSSATPAKDSLLDAERLANARKRLQENYQEAQNAKKQRTIQMMGIHEIPKPKNAFISRNKGGHHQTKHW